jgi:hypothetical protein
MDPTTLITGAKWALDATKALNNTASALKSLKSSIPPLGYPKRDRLPERQHTYMDFQRSAMDLMTHVEFLSVLAALEARPIYRVFYAIAALVQESETRTTPSARTHSGSRSAMTISPVGAASALEKLLLFDRVEATTNAPLLINALAEHRGAMARFLGALMVVRQYGNPGPREAAERITGLLGELSEYSTPDPTFPFWKAAAMGSRTARRQGNEEFRRVCQQLLGEAHRDFTVAARQDLGYDKKPRRWLKASRHTRWHLWLRRAPVWPGGWPGPDARQLVMDRLEQERNIKPTPTKDQ